MSRYMIDGRAFETKDAKQKFEEGNRWDGRNHISLATGSQWEHETLYLSKKDQWYIVYLSGFLGQGDYARCVDCDEAAQWLLCNEYELEDMPADLRLIAEANCE